MGTSLARRRTPLGSSSQPTRLPVGYLAYKEARPLRTLHEACLQATSRIRRRTPLEPYGRLISKGRCIKSGAHPLENDSAPKSEPAKREPSSLLTGDVYYYQITSFVAIGECVYKPPFDRQTQRVYCHQGVFIKSPVQCKCLYFRFQMLKWHTKSFEPAACGSEDGTAMRELLFRLECSEFRIEGLGFRVCRGTSLIQSRAPR